MCRELCSCSTLHVLQAYGTSNNVTWHYRDVMSAEGTMCVYDKM